LKNTQRAFQRAKSSGHMAQSQKMFDVHQPYALRLVPYAFVQMTPVFIQKLTCFNP
jgi:hypothetical protein